MIKSNQSSNITSIPNMSNKQHIKNMDRQSISGEDIIDMTVNKNDYHTSLKFNSSQSPKINQSQKLQSLSMDMIPSPEDMKNYNTHKKESPMAGLFAMGTSFMLCKIFSNDVF